MPRKTSKILTQAEMRLMRVLWKHGPSTVADVQRALGRRRPLAYNSVLTTLRILEDKGYVSHVKDGRAFVYRARVEAAKVNRSAVRFLLERFFDNSSEDLVANMIESGDLDPAELKRIRGLLDKADPDD